MNERAKVPPHPFPTGSLTDTVGSDDTGSRTINPSKLLHSSVWKKTERGREGEANLGLECSPFQSAGNSDKEVAMGTMGIGRRGGTGPIHTVHGG